MIILLESVATAIDDETLITYAMYNDGHVDWSSELPLSSCNENWYSSLSKEDKLTIEHLKDVKNYLR
jgi:hypothetical protein